MSNFHEDFARSTLDDDPATVEVNVTVNDQNVVAIWREINTMAPWMDRTEQRRWAERLAAVCAQPPSGDAPAYVRGHWDGLHCEADTGFGILDECEHVGRIHEPKVEVKP